MCGFVGAFITIGNAVNGAGVRIVKRGEMTGHCEKVVEAW